MNETPVRDRIKVSGIGKEFPFIMLELRLLDRARAILDAAGIKYEVDSFYVTLGDDPPRIVINIHRGTDGAMVQEVLDRN